MGEEHKDYTWNLIAKKLTGEASPEELKELEILLRNNPELHYPMQTVSDLWNSSSPIHQKQAEHAFNRHLDRIQTLNLDFDPDSDFDSATDGDFESGGESRPHGEPEPRRESRSLNESGSDRDLNIPAGIHSPEEADQDHPYSSRDRTYSSATDQYPYPFATKRSGPGRKALLLASALCLCLGLAAAIWLYPKSKPIASVAAGTSAMPNGMSGGEIFTTNGSKTHLLLPDSTLVWLNAGSHIKYDKAYGATRREVYLTGEAYFDVARNAEKPFIIHTDRIDIKVLGTSFNIRSYPADKTTEATLIHGSIEVSMRNRPGARIILKPNQKIIVANDDSTLRHIYTGQPGPATHNELPMIIRKPTYEQNTGTMIETSWIDNKLIFQDEEFGTLAKDLERWYGVSIRFTDPAQQQWHFTGTFQKETIEQALDALKMTAGFTYTIKGTQISIFTKE